MCVLLEWFQFEHMYQDTVCSMAQESGAYTNGVSQKQSHISIATSCLLQTAPNLQWS